MDRRATLALLDPDEATARAILHDALATRIARWQSERAGIDECEEPGCRGASDGCLLLHPDRRRRATGDVAPAPAGVAWQPSGISRAHDERSDRRARLRGAGWCPSDLVVPACARLGADPAAMLAGRRHPAECQARALIAFVACDGVGLPGATVAELLGVGGPAITAARRRGANVLTSHGWTVDEVLSWTDAKQLPT